MNDLVIWGEISLIDLGVLQLIFLRELLMLGILHDEQEGVVVTDSRVDVETFLDTEGPGDLCDSFFVDNETASEWDDDSGVIIKGSVEALPSLDVSVESDLSEEIKGVIQLIYKEIPEVFWEVVVDAHKDGNEVVLEFADGVFGGVAEMYVRGYELVSDLPLLLNDTLVFSADFIIYNLDVDFLDLWGEALHDGVVGGNATLVLLVIERGDKDGVEVTILGSQGLLITAVIEDGEASSVVRVLI